MSVYDALVGGRVFTGEVMLPDHAVIIEGDAVAAVVPSASLPADIRRIDHTSDLIAPGFIDVQVNGGGGVFLNDEPTAEGMARVYAAHKRGGTTHYLPTIITSGLETMLRAIDAVPRAAAMTGGGVLGLHLEGPYISHEKPGVHDPRYIRAASGAELETWVTAVQAGSIHCLMTAAPECMTPAQMAHLVRAGVIISLGHTNATYEQAQAAFAAGATGVTHLYNAMSALEHRAPGVVGAALRQPGIFAGLIADGYHVHWGAVQIAYRLIGDRLVLVTDAMPPVGAPEMTTFRLSDREVFVAEGRLVDASGRLAGANIDMAACVRLSVEHAGIPLDDALRMASLSPARLLGLDAHLGRIRPGCRASLTVLDAALKPRALVVGGRYEAIHN